MGLRQECIEARLRRGIGSTRRRLPHQPALRRLEPGPNWYFRGQIHFAPLGVAWRLLKLIELAEEGVHEARDLIVSVCMRRPCEHCHDVADGNRRHRCAGRDERRISVMRELIRKIGLREGLVEPSGIGAPPIWITAAMSPRFCACSALTCFSCSTFALMPRASSGSHCRTAAGDIDVDSPAVQTLDLRDVVASKHMNRLVV
jgi:hypothetical protein